MSSRQEFSIKDVRYVLKDEGNYEVRFPQIRKQIHFKDFFKMLQDPRMTPNPKMTTAVVQEARNSYLQSRDVKDIFKVLKKYKIPIHTSFEQLLTSRKRRTPLIIKDSSLPPTKKRILPSIPKPSTPLTTTPRLTQALRFPFEKKRRRVLSQLPAPFPTGSKVNVQIQKQVSSFFSPGKLIDCLNVEYNRVKNSLYVKTILWFKNFKDCFKQKIQLKQIVQFLKETADELQCQKIYLDDQSYIPVSSLTKKMVNDFNNQKSTSHHPPFFKVLLTMSEGQTLYMKEGFFCLPKEIINHIDRCIEEFPEQKDRILRNTLVLNQAFSYLVLNCTTSLTLKDVLPEMTGLPDSLSVDSSIQDVSKWIKKDFQKNLFDPTHSLEVGWRLYDALSNASFARPELFVISSQVESKNFITQFIKNLNLALQIPIRENDWNTVLVHQELRLKTTNVSILNKYELLCQLLWSLSSSFCETAMFRRSNGTWSRFHLPGSSPTP